MMWESATARLMECEVCRNEEWCNLGYEDTPLCIVCWMSEGPDDGLEGDD